MENEKIIEERMRKKQRRRARQEQKTMMSGQISIDNMTNSASNENGIVRNESIDKLTNSIEEIGDLVDG